MDKEDKTHPRVSIIVLNRNGLEDTVECLESLKKITYPNYRVIVVDNGSHGNDVRVLKEDFEDYVEVIENDENHGFAEGCNIGIGYALQTPNTDYVLLLNNDTVVDPDFLSELVSVAEYTPEVGIVGSTIYDYKEPNRIQYAGGGMNWWLGRPYHYRTGEYELQKTEMPPQEVDHVSGCCMLLSTRLGDEMLFDAAYFAYFEDADLCIRVKRKGFKLVYVPSSRVWHKLSRTSGSHSEFYNYHLSRNRILLMKRNGGLIHWLTFLPFQVVVRCVGALFVFGIKQRSLRSTRAWMRGMLDGLRL